jgi:hypothetical protein
VPDQIEVAMGTDPHDPNSNPLTNASAPPETLNIGKVQISLNFASSGKDSISIAGFIPMPAGFSFAGKQVAFDVGGVQQVFVLNARGQSAPKGLRIRTKPSSGGTSQYTLLLRNGAFSSVLSASGLTNTTVVNAAISARVMCIFNGVLYQTDRSLVYSAKQGKSGKAK